jgi:hypothetical protein
MAKVMDGARTQLSGKADGLVYVQFNSVVTLSGLTTLTGIGYAIITALFKVKLIIGNK